MVLFHAPGADRQPRKHLLPALVRLQHELAKVSGGSGKVRHRADPALGEEPGEAGAEPGGEDLAVVTPHAGTQLQRDGARHLQHLFVAAVQEQDPAGHQVDEDQAVSVGAEGDQAWVGCLDIGELLGGVDLGPRVQGPDPGRGPGGERGDGRRGRVQQQGDPGSVEACSAQRGQVAAVGCGVVGEGFGGRCRPVAVDATFRA